LLLILQLPLLEMLACFLVAWYVEDINSGMTHIVLDNPRTLKIPLLHAGAVGFQNHHEYPAAGLHFPFSESFCVYFWFVPMFLTFWPAAAFALVRLARRRHRPRPEARVSSMEGGKGPSAGVQHLGDPHRRIWRTLGYAGVMVFVKVQASVFLMDFHA
jgi:hypothetical protein